MSLGADDIKKIVKACKQAGVTELKVGDLVVKFGRHPDTVSIESTRVVELPLIPDAKELEETQKLSELQTEADEGDEMVANLLLEDPERYEQLLVERELGDREVT